MIPGFFLRVSAEGSQAAVSAAIGMEHQEDGFGLVQAHGETDLLQHEFAVVLVLWRSQVLGAAGDADGVVIVEPQALDEFPQRQLEAVVETPDDGCVALVSFPRRLEMKELLHGNTMINGQR